MSAKIQAKEQRIVAFPPLPWKHFRSIPSCLGRREINGPSARKELGKAIEDQIIRNIAKDRFSTQEIKIYSRSSGIARSHHLVAAREGTSTSLWNVLLGLKLWECALLRSPSELYSKNFEHLETLVDKSGVVIHVYRVPFDTPTCVEIFLDGKNTGSLFFEEYMACFRLVNGHIFTIGLDPNPERRGLISRGELNLYEWDLTGSLIRKLSLAALKENDTFREDKTWRGAFAENEDYFILCAGTRAGTRFVRSATSSKIFIFDFKTGLSRVFDLEVSSDDLTIGSIFLRGNRLIIGSNKVRRNNAQITEFDPKIIDFNLLTGKIERTYPIESSRGGEIKHLIANETQAIFINWQGDIKDYVYSIDLSSGGQKKLLGIPCCENDENIQLSLMGKFLIACYPVGYWHNTGVATQIRSVVDLNTGETSQTEYKR